LGGPSELEETKDMKPFIHGVPVTGFLWTPVVTVLGLGEADYLATTLPGFDCTRPAGFDAPKKAYLDWVTNLLVKTAQKHEPVDLVGHNWGALLSMLAAHRRPEAVRSRPAINALPEPSYEAHGMARKWQTPILGALLMALTNEKRPHAQLLLAGMLQYIADHEVSRIGKTVKTSNLALYRSAKDLKDWDEDFSALAGRG